jgi:hypothetical protein
VALTLTLLVEGAYGVEDNVFTSLNDDVDGTYWDAGFQWQPLARVSVCGLRGAVFRRYAALQRELPQQALDAAGGVQRDIQYPRDIRAATPGAARTECAGAAGHGGAGQPPRQRSVRRPSWVTRRYRTTASSCLIASSGGARSS